MWSPASKHYAWPAQLSPCPTPPSAQLPNARQVWSVPDASVGAAATQQATRHARRIYVGGLPPGASEESLSVFLRCDPLFFL